MSTQLNKETPVGKKWTYGDEGQAYPVKKGETWKCGKHIFHCSDLMESKSFDALLVTLKPDVLYCDPPWGQSLVNSFRTKAGLDKAEYRWEDLYKRIASIGHQRGIPLWVEGSKIEHRDGKKIPETLAAEGYGCTAYAELVYYRKHPMGLYYAGRQHPPLNPQTLAGIDDDYTPGLVMEAYGKIGTVVDPCAGRGQTSRQAHYRGWKSVNNELNPFRVSASLVRLSKITDDMPERVA